MLKTSLVGKNDRQTKSSRYLRDSGNNVNKLRDSGIHEKLVRDSVSRPPPPPPLPDSVLTGFHCTNTGNAGTRTKSFDPSKLHGYSISLTCPYTMFSYLKIMKRAEKTSNNIRTTQSHEQPPPRSNVSLRFSFYFSRIHSH